jgi:uncharacterized membrane protein YeaQ/YmgE (transglycosylase-associated protein family)
MVAGSKLETATSNDWEVVMGILAWIVLGLVAGAIAKLILPGRQGGGWILTLLLGIVGAVVGAFLGQLFFGTVLGDLGDLKTWLLAVGGSVVVLLVYGLLTRGSRKA